MTFRRTIRRAFAVPKRLLFPEGLVLTGLLALPHVPEVFRVVEPRAHLLLAAVGASGLAIGWRFARGRVVHGILVVGAAAAALRLLPGGSSAASLAALLVPLNLAALSVLRDRGIMTRGGLARTGALVLQAAAIAALAVFRPDDAGDPLAAVTVPAIGLALHPTILVYAAALATLGVLTLGSRGAAPARGALWATAGALAAHLGYPGGPTYLMAAAGLALVVASLEDAYALAYRDGLTGIPSRRALDELLDRTARRFTVAMVDIDHFKAFNDRYGHDVGDQVLRMVAARLRETGGGGRAFRYGGEEFAVVFRGRTLEEARPYLDAVRERIATAQFVLRGPNRPKKKPKQILPPRRPLKKLTVTVSIGAADRTPRSRPAAEVLKTADEALYRAKEAGRNRVVAARS